MCRKKSTLKDYTSAKTGKLCPPGLRKGDLNAAVGTGEVSVSTWPVMEAKRRSLGRISWHSSWLSGDIQVSLGWVGTFKFLSQEAFHSYLFKSFCDGILWVIKYHGLGQNVLHKDSHRSVEPSRAIHLGLGSALRMKTLMKWHWKNRYKLIKKNKILIDSNKICMKTNKSDLCFLAASPSLEATTVPPLVQAPHALLNSGQHPSRSLAGLAHLLCLQNHGSNLHLVLLIHK